jgi:hypothetical protein
VLQLVIFSSSNSKELERQVNGNGNVLVNSFVNLKHSVLKLLLTTPKVEFLEENRFSCNPDPGFRSRGFRYVFVLYIFLLSFSMKPIVFADSVYFCVCVTKCG